MVMLTTRGNKQEKLAAERQWKKKFALFFPRIISHDEKTGDKIWIWFDYYEEKVIPDERSLLSGGKTVTRRVLHSQEEYSYCKDGYSGP
jgi:hypothetical protein